MFNINDTNVLIARHKPTYEEGSLRIGFNTHTMTFELVYSEGNILNGCSIARIHELHYDLNNMIAYLGRVHKYFEGVQGARTLERMYHSLSRL